MAPPEGPRGMTPPAGPRGSRGGHRGGIQKRRGGGPIKVDRDGDMVMGVDGGSSKHSGSGSGTENGGRRSGRGSRASAPARSESRQQAILRALGKDAGAGQSTRSRRGDGSVTLVVRGLQQSKASHNDGGGLRDLLSFLERKATTVGKLSRPVTIKKSRVEGDLVYISASEENAAEIVKLNGFSFAGATLEVAVHEGGWPQETGLSPSSQETKAQLQHILSLRYDGSQKLLNLSHLDQDPGLIAMGMFQEKVVPEKLFAAIMAVCDGLFTSRQAKREAIESITLAGNSIDNVSQIMPLADTFPDLKNLDLSNNNIQDIKGLARWRNRLPRLEALLMMGNPIETNEPNYKMEVINWFPRLVNFNGVTVRTPEDVARAEEARKPHAIPHSGTSFRDVNGIGASFIMEFFPAYDTDRANLAAKFYDDESTFSLSVVTQIPKRPHGAVASWASYLKFSRNLTKVTSLPARVQRLFTGTALIQTVWKGLPATRHPSLTSETHKYLVDCQPMLGLPDPTGQSIAGVDGLAINMHGEFDEIDPQTGKQGKRSFSRSFILGPGKPGQQLIRVINDMLTIRAWTPLPNVNAPTPTGSPVDIRKQMIIELSQRTNMTLEYAELCLVGANWDFDTAMAMFNEKRAQLPPEAFVQP